MLQIGNEITFFVEDELFDAIYIMPDPSIFAHCIVAFKNIPLHPGIIIFTATGCGFTKEEPCPKKYQDYFFASIPVKDINFVPHFSLQQLTGKLKNEIL